MINRTTPSMDRSFQDMWWDNVEIEFDATHVLEWVASEFEPEDVFPTDALEMWATDNGYVLED